MLKGTELLNAIRTMETASRTEQCLACGYVRQDGKPAFTSFYEAIMEARGITTAAIEKEELLTEYKDSDELETLQELLEDYGADAIRAFIECFGDGSLESFTDSYQGEMTGAESLNRSLRIATASTSPDSWRLTGKQPGRIWSVTITASRMVSSLPVTSDSKIWAAQYSA